MTKHYFDIKISSKTPWRARKELKMLEPLGPILWPINICFSFSILPF